MRVAFLVHKFPTLSQTFILNQVTGLLDAGHEVDIYASGADNGSRVHTDVDQYRLLERTHYWNVPRSYVLRGLKAGGLTGNQGWQALSLRLLYGSVRFFGRKAYDIIHCQFGTLLPTAAALHDMGVARGRLVVSFRGADLSTQGGSGRYRGLFQKGHLFLPVCERLKTRLVEQGCDPSKIRVHHSGIKLSRFVYAERRRLGDEPIRALTVGRLVEKKGIAYGLEAVARLKASGRPVRYTVAGDGPLRSELDRMTEKLGLGREVQLVGPKKQEEVIALLRGAHVLVAPSVTAGNGDQEGIPNALKEAMATGIPVLSTQHGGIPELVQDGVSGLLVPERDSEALADRLAYLIDHPDRWSAMGRAGRARIEAEFDSDKLNQELIGIYQRVVSKQPG